MKLTKHLLRRTLALGGVLALAFLPFTSSAQTANTGVIEGRVSNSAAGNYLKQVRLVVEGTAFETFTNESGEFRLDGVPGGEVPVRASAAGLGLQSARVT